jgi:hypothetical protein
MSKVGSKATTHEVATDNEDVPAVYKTEDDGKKQQGQKEDDGKKQQGQKEDDGKKQQGQKEDDGKKQQGQKEEVDMTKDGGNKEESGKKEDTNVQPSSILDLYELMKADCFICKTSIGCLELRDGCRGGKGGSRFDNDPTKTMFVMAKDLLITHCFHVFHAECIYKHCESADSTPSSNACCPMCETIIILKDAKPHHVIRK